MAYLHCHNCDFSQDDYWCKSYNPIRWLLNWEEGLLDGEIDKPFTTDASFIQENGNISLREVIARELERKAKTIREMKYRTHEEFLSANTEQACPVCGQKELDVD